MTRALRAASEALALLAGWAVVGLALVVTLETILRKFLGISIQGIDEYGGYVLAVASAVGFSYACLGRAHIRVDVAVRLLPAPLRAWADVVAVAALGAYAAMLALAGLRLTLASWDYSARAVSPLQTPLVVPQGLWTFGLALFVLACVAVGVQALSAALRRDWAAVGRAAGTPDAAEEVAEEVAQARRRAAGDATP